MDKNSPASCPVHTVPGAASSSSPHKPEWPPGPPSGLTGWGLMARMARDLLGTLEEWRQSYGDVFHLRLWPEHEVVVADPELARDLLITHHDRLIRWERGTQVFEQLHGQSVFTAEGEAWKAKRQALQPSFSPRAAQDFIPTIVASVAAGLQAWPQQQGYWPIESALTRLTMDVILRLVFSSTVGEDAAAAAQAVHTVSSEANKDFYWPVSLPNWLPWKAAKRRAYGVLTDLIDRHVRARLSQPPEAWPPDLLSRLLALHRDQPAAWPLRAVRDECMTAFIAGHETVAATLTWWSWCLATHPETQSQVRAEIEAAAGDQPPSAATLAAMPLLTQTLHETLRLYPAAPVLLARRAREPVPLGDWMFPARTIFLIPVHAVQQDARWFPDPMAFKPERFAPGAPEIPRGAYMPFGAGPRVCLGQRLALTEMTVIAAMLLQRFDLSVPPGMAAPHPMFTVTLRPDAPLTLELTRRT